VVVVAAVVEAEEAEAEARQEEEAAEARQEEVAAEAVASRPTPGPSY
jgi:hypothetical protein